MKLWLTRCHGGRYLLTALRPLLLPIRGYRDENGQPVIDAFERGGEPIAVRYLCEGGIRSLFKKDFPMLDPIKIDLTAYEIVKKENQYLGEKDVDFDDQNDLSLH